MWPKIRFISVTQLMEFEVTICFEFDKFFHPFNFCFTDVTRSVEAELVHLYAFAGIFGHCNVLTPEFFSSMQRIEFLDKRQSFETVMPTHFPLRIFNCLYSSHHAFIIFSSWGCLQGKRSLTRCSEGSWECPCRLQRHPSNFLQVSRVGQSWTVTSRPRVDCDIL